MINQPSYKFIELIVVFIILPVSLVLDFSPFLKLGIALTGITYCVWVMVKIKLLSKKKLTQIDFKGNWKRLLITFIVIALSSTLFLYYVHPENLFIVIKKKPTLWFGVLLIYTFLSALPQELIYRSFFFERYQTIFSKPYYLIWTNILVFPLAHLLFDNVLVLLVAFIGGMIFTTTYYRTKSVLFTSMEHAIYGNWLFTIGMGEMLAFPMPN